MKKRRGFLAVLLAGMLLLLCGCGGVENEEESGILINGTAYAEDLDALDLRGTAQPELEQIAKLTGLKTLDLRDTGITAEEYQTIQSALPECRILWSVPFQGGWLDSDTQSVTVTSLTAEDVEQLDHLEELTRVDAADCGDAEQLLALQQRRPECQVDYTLEIRGQRCGLDTAELTLEDLSAQELEQWLPHLKSLETITLTGIQEDPEALLDMMEANPQITFCWDMELLGVTVNSQTTEVDISGIIVEDLESLEKLVTRLPRLEQVVMCGCGISNEEMDALNRRYEDIKFVWTISLRGVEFRTDITYLMPYQYDLWLNDDCVMDLKYLTELECLDLGHHNIHTCEFAAYMPNMKYLLLGDTGVSDLTPLMELENLIYLEIFMTGVRDYTPLLSLENLECLNLCYTNGDLETVAQLTWVDYIRWINTEPKKLTMTQQNYLAECLPDTLLELGYSQSSTGGQWRKTQQYYDMRDILGMWYMTG